MSGVGSVGLYNQYTLPNYSVNYNDSSYLPNYPVNYNDSCFLQAYQSFNANNPAFKGGNTNTDSITSAKDTTTTATTNTNSIMQNINTSALEEKKGMSTGGKVLTVTTLVGAAVYIAGAVKGKSLRPTKVWEGLKSLFNVAKDKIFPTDLPRIIRNESGCVTCNIPGRQNIIRGVEGLTEIGAESGIPKVTSEAIKDKLISLRSFEFTEGGEIYRVVKNTIMKKIPGSDHFAPIKDAPDAVKTLVNQFKNGENIDRLTNIVYTDGINGTKGIAKRLFSVAKFGETEELKGAISKHLGVNSLAVQRYCLEHPEFKKGLELAIDNKVPEGYRRFSGIYKFDDGAKLTIENGEIKSFTQRVGTKDVERDLDSDIFKMYQEAHKADFEKLTDAKKLDGFLTTTWTF